MDDDFIRKRSERKFQFVEPLMKRDPGIIEQ